ncbi:hypothetical protein A1O3_10279 [Capronia epimyces CBS 606.96]|uniref:Uncharacterized protein n=1 Tax=Capronia epimyces CBS 606.96 TaxID=1182542 RepID=W9XJG7_9EURO|nr:uncharacterized protein A1O3_10279 [Capronia epimyces CBS 606.96]EXJ77121.1 hypothetical protein A1O3_10279 [Capronia epimyces CBS 606.96]
MPLAKGVVNILGVATEAYAHHKQKKEATSRSLQPSEDCSRSSTSSSTLSSSSSSPVGFVEDDDDEWLRDEAQEQLKDGTETDTQIKMVVLPPNVEAQQFASPSQSPGLPCPVILPQRRPESKSKGFVRAYAPDLAGCGIDQATWLQFLADFEQSVKGEGYFHAVNLSIAAGVLTYTVAAATVNPAVHLAAFAVHTSIEAGRRLRNTREINKYLESMNEELFKPRGLYALLMTYKPTSSESVVGVDMKQSVASSIMSRNSGQRTKFRTASGKTYGDAELPECAPLVFPALDAANPEQKQNAFKRAGAFMSDYRDRRARAQFEHNNPDSRLNILPQEKFSSIFADPNHPINKGGSLNVITGGYLYKGAKALRDGGAGNALPFKLGRQAGKEGTGVGGTSGQFVKRIIGENVLYLMVVNMPTEEEMRQAARLEERARAMSAE